MRLISFFLMLALALPVLAKDRVIPVRFAPGTTGSQMVEGIARGETATFTLEAGTGQKMRVGLTSVESNAEFELLAPNGQSLGNSSLKNGQQIWYGVLPQSGRYKVVVGTTRGGAEITIDFSVR